jgi:pimeloyl-ACP methyl ester carboxylesterase
MVSLNRRIVRPTALLAFADSGGASRAIVLMHGAGLDHSMYDEQADALAEQGYRVIAWDLRGHGDSTPAAGTPVTAADLLGDLSALLDECAVDQCVLVGHSLGGNLAQAYVRAHPERVVGHIVMDATWNAGPLSPIERLALRSAAPALRLIAARSLPHQMARVSAVTPEGIARAEATFARMTKSRFIDVWRATVEFVRPDPSYRSPVPLALIRGERDRTGNIAAAMPRWAARERITENVIDGAGHILTWDAPEETSAALLRILDGWQRRGAAS